MHLGHLVDKEEILDKILVAVFKAPHSYTGEDLLEISCHGSPYIVRRVIQLFIRKGARSAQEGEFTLRAFLNGKIDLSQAEAISDLISSTSKTDHQLAMHQLKGGVLNQIRYLRKKLIEFSSLIEFSLDFTEEDDSTYDKTQLSKLLIRIKKHIQTLLDSFALGNAIKEGIPVVIVGKPNVGKSTLLNVLLNEERAIVSDIPGTTRDIIEDEIIIDGIRFRFIDTAGIRNTQNRVEVLGIKKTFEKMQQAKVIFYMFDATSFKEKTVVEEIQNLHTTYTDKTIFIIANKSDMTKVKDFPYVFFSISAKKKEGIQSILKALSNTIDRRMLQNRPILTHIRHYNALHRSLKAICNIEKGIQENHSGDILAVDIRQALESMGEISGEISSEELLKNIFSKFCIGK